MLKKTRILLIPSFSRLFSTTTSDLVQSGRYRFYEGCYRMQTRNLPARNTLRFCHDIRLLFLQVHGSILENVADECRVRLHVLMSNKVETPPQLDGEENGDGAEN
ncbi:hypothetical protein K435DRAFT_394456 [Dendrothele bispora CBS 962.96]|uniref:Uncharacterized protein n=1 Tax=Dendrothele bispora (strain CBS 962.96) TaxID=1314807 RepID=A0A4S8L8M1_DENBC|nr:hypothetical protein K435DRAFT_394456 [Dendrothele bispora CBS 962.96]